MTNQGIQNRFNNWLKSNYGSKRGFLLNYFFRVLSIFGRYNQYKHHDISSVERVIFICKGNICRSAYAEAVAKTLGLNAISCGIHANESASANEGAIRVAKAKGIDLDSHRTTPIMNVKFKKTDLLLVMEPWQAEAVTKFIDKSIRVSFLGFWANPKLPYIHDPYGLSPLYFEKCFNYIEKSVYGTTEKICKKETD